MDHILMMQEEDRPAEPPPGLLHLAEYDQEEGVRLGTVYAHPILRAAAAKASPYEALEYAVRWGAHDLLRKAVDRDPLIRRVYALLFEEAQPSDPPRTSRESCIDLLREVVEGRAEKRLLPSGLRCYVHDLEEKYFSAVYTICHPEGW